MKNLVIGNTSQLSYYFDDTHVKISSRNINISDIVSTKWNKVFICHAEQRTFIAENKESEKLFYQVNCQETINLVDKIKNFCNHIVYYSTAELWNKYNGPIDLDLPMSFHENSYTLSKYYTTKHFQYKFKYPNVSIIYPFNFNSVHRRSEYLFGKIFQSVLNKQKIKIGDINYYRDILHPSDVVNKSISVSVGEDALVGSGRLIHIGDFIKSIYEDNQLDFESYVESDESKKSIYRNFIFYNKQYCPQINEKYLLRLISSEIKGIKNG